MDTRDAERLQTYLRKRLGNSQLEVALSKRKGGTPELRVGGEVLGTVHRDVEDGEVSFAVHLVILEEDLEEAAPAPAQTPTSRRRA